jgi:two-component system alkaline phosphatase synthesis response regulator PhoP
MGRNRILIVEDDKDIRELMEYNLKKDGFEARGVGSGEGALEAVSRELPELVLLDLMLPGIDGFEVCRRLKTGDATGHIPIVVVSAKGEEADIVTGLELGADDYITKPFSPKVLVARVRAVLRRRARQVPKEEDVLKVLDITIHPGRREVVYDDERIELTNTEFKVLHLLARRPGWVFTRYQIVDRIHGEHYPVTERSVDVQIVGLRRKLGAAGDYIETVRGVGYRFRDDD